MSTVQFALMKMGHQTWRLKLRAFLSGREDIDPKQLTSHEDCTLGKWLYSTGMAQYGRLRDLQDLEKKHKHMHNLVREVVDMKRLGRSAEAEREYQKVRVAADQVVALLTALESQIKSAESISNLQVK